MPKKIEFELVEKLFDGSSEGCPDLDEEDIYDQSYLINFTDDDYERFRKLNHEERVNFLTWIVNNDITDDEWRGKRKFTIQETIENLKKRIIITKRVAQLYIEYLLALQLYLKDCKEAKENE